MKKDLTYYRALPYSRTVTRFKDEEDGKVYFCVSFKEIPEIKGVHEDRPRAIQLANELFDAYVVAQLAWKEHIDEPEVQRYRRGGLRNIEPQSATNSAEQVSPKEFQAKPKSLLRERPVTVS